MTRFVGNLASLNFYEVNCSCNLQANLKIMYKKYILSFANIYNKVKNRSLFQKEAPKKIQKTQTNAIVH